MHAIDCEGGGKATLDKWLEGWFYTLPVAEARGMAGLRRGLQYLGLVNGEVGRKVEMYQVKRGNVEEFLAGTFFNLPLATVLSQPLAHHSLLSLITALEHRRNHRFESGCNPSVRPLCPSMGGVKMRYTPLGVYLAMGVGEGVLSWGLWVLGFGWAKTTPGEEGSMKAVTGGREAVVDTKGTVGAWYHPGMRADGGGLLCWAFDKIFPVGHQTSVDDHNTVEDNRSVKMGLDDCSKPKKKPIIFIPGLAGPSLLIHLIISLLTLDQPLFVIYQPHLSLSLFATPAPSTPDLVRGIEALLERYGFSDKSSGSERGERGLVVAHSLGSGLAAALNDNSAYPTSSVIVSGKDRGKRFRTILLDPVSILICHPHLARTINISKSEGGMARLVKYFTEEVGVARYLAREFSPFDNHFSLIRNSSSFRPRLPFAQTDWPTGDLSSDQKLDRVGSTTVLLSRNDHLLPIEKIATHCIKNGVRCQILENIGHGGWLFSLPLFLHVLEAIRSNVRLMNGGFAPVSMPSTQNIARLDDRPTTPIDSPTIPASTPIKVILSRQSFASSSVRTRSRSGTMCEKVKGDDLICQGGRSRSRTLTSCGVGGVGMMIGRSKLGDGSAGKMDRLVSLGRDRDRLLSSKAAGIDVWT
ncbi:hypothetical protein IAR55_002221 [Kwoniella newhampshirensis]|uniref:AB hydrolase-1 domain-containing protein n=1 Tax=Kwoniella newhampshirensis TaxID=1651941 RepID=A0AAW0YTV2_9TREE